MNIKAILGIITGMTLLASCTIAEADTEYAEHKLAREQVHVYSATYDCNTELEWYKLRTAYSEELDQMTVTYWLFSHGKQEQGDIGAFAEIYNPEGTSWNNKDFAEMVVEITRFDWATITIKANSKEWILPPVTSDNKLITGYLTIRVPVRR